MPFTDSTLLHQVQTSIYFVRSKPSSDNNSVLRIVILPHLVIGSYLCIVKSTGPILKPITIPIQSPQYYFKAFLTSSNSSAKSSLGDKCGKLIKLNDSQLLLSTK